MVLHQRFFFFFKKKMGKWKTIFNLRYLKIIKSHCFSPAGYSHVRSPRASSRSRAGSAAPPPAGEQRKDDPAGSWVGWAELDTRIGRGMRCRTLRSLAPAPPETVRTRDGTRACPELWTKTNNWVVNDNGHT